MTEKQNLALKIIMAIFLVIVVAIGVTLWKNQYLPKVNASTYQAVFFDNGQQYFGHLNKVGTRHPYLTDIYYFQPKFPASANPADQGVNLIKFGKELHGPEDKMYLNWQHVIFWENLAADSQTVKSIMQEKLLRANQQQVPPSAPSSAPASAE